MYHYKDCNPSDTIDKFKKILSDLGLTFNENICSPINDIWSCSLSCNELEGIAANGKGLTRDLCLASAYGEFFELLENFPMMCGSDYKNQLDFNFFPDEKIIKTYNIKEVNDGLYLDIKSLKSFSNQGEICLSDLKPVEFVPFNNITDNDVVYLPYSLIRFLNMTSGAAAGNTYEEACVESLSELLERYSIKEIIEKRLTPPEIERYYISENYSDLFNIILRIETELDTEVKVYDCSLGRKFPVVCIVSYDRKNHTYRSKFGSHPLFSVALERCLTEFYQSFSKDIHRKSLVNLERYDKSVFDTQKLYTSFFVYGIQILPYEFFYKKPSWSLTDWMSEKYYTNKKGFDYLKKVIEEDGHKIYIRDNSWLKVPAVYIYIPGVSYIKKHITKNTIRLYDRYNSLFNEVEDIEKNKRKSDIVFMTDFYLSGMADTLVDVKTAGQEDILAALNISIKRYDVVIRILENIAVKTNEHECLIEDLKLLMDNVSSEDRYKILSLFYEYNSVKNVKNIWESDHIISSLHEKIKDNLEAIALIPRVNKKELYLRERNESVSLRIKETMKNNYSE